MNSICQRTHNLWAIKKKIFHFMSCVNQFSCKMFTHMILGTINCGMYRYQKAINEIPRRYTHWHTSHKLTISIKILFFFHYKMISKFPCHLQSLILNVIALYHSPICAIEKNFVSSTKGYYINRNNSQNTNE